MANIKMHYSIEPKNRIYIKSYGFLSFSKNIGKYLRNKYSQTLLDSAKKYTTHAMKTASKREATGDLTENKIADKITSVSKNSSHNNLEAVKSEEGIAKKI